jgi:hypothetical protein
MPEAFMRLLFDRLDGVHRARNPLTQKKTVSSFQPPAARKDRLFAPKPKKPDEKPNEQPDAQPNAPLANQLRINKIVISGVPEDERSITPNQLTLEIHGDDRLAHEELRVLLTGDALQKSMSAVERAELVPEQTAHGKSVYVLHLRTPMSVTFTALLAAKRSYEERLRNLGAGTGIELQIIPTEKAKTEPTTEPDANPIKKQTEITTEVQRELLKRARELRRPKPPQ